jgi:RNA polymerase sigma-70 factor (ECF subfamily)
MSTPSDSSRYDEFAELVQAASRRILSYIQALVLNWSDAEDIYQDTCLLMWQKFDQFTPGTNFLAWALCIAQNKVMDLQKKRSRQAVFTAGLREMLMTEVVTRKSDDAAEDLTALSDCMELLTASDHDLVMQCHGHDVPVRQLAEQLGRSPESVHHSLARIRRRLLECIRRELRRKNTPSALDEDLPDEGLPDEDLPDEDLPDEEDPS